MILTAHQIDAIRRRAKTTHRIPASMRDYSTRVVAGRTQVSRPSRPDVGRTVPVQRYQGADPACHVMILEARVERHGDLTYEDAKAEGYGNAEHYVRAWLAEHDRAWLDRAVDQPDPIAARTIERVPWQACSDRWLARWADRPVWVITFEIAHRPTYMARSGSMAPNGRTLASTDHDHTASPAKAIDELPLVEPGELERQRVLARHQEEAARAERARMIDSRNLGIEERLALARRAAELRRIDLGDTWYLRGVRRRYGDHHPKTLQCVETLERRAGLRPAA